MIKPIQQGDQFYLPVVIKQDKVEITPENADDVKIKIGDVLKKYSLGELTYGLYDTEKSAWLYPLTQAQTLSYKGATISIQAQIKQGANVFGSDTNMIPIDFSIIQEEW